MKAVVNRIIPFSSVDGPGNRTAIFLQGCNINCKYCHNPETRKMCVQCGTCVKNCPAGALSMGTDGKVKFDPAKCVQCDTCIHVCPNDSSPRTCEMTPEEVYERVKKQIPFIRGISVSGGECMLQPEFLTELFRLAKKDGLGTLIDSNGMVPFENYPELMEVADGVMLDIKAFGKPLIPPCPTTRARPSPGTSRRTTRSQPRSTPISTTSRWTGCRSAWLSTPPSALR